MHACKRMELDALKHAPPEIRAAFKKAKEELRMSCNPVEFPMRSWLMLKTMYPNHDGRTQVNTAVQSLLKESI